MTAGKERTTVLRLGEIQKRINQYRKYGDLTALAKEVNISRPILYKIAWGTANVRYDTLEKLSDYLEDNHGKSEQQTS